MTKEEQEQLLSVLRKPMPRASSAEARQRVLEDVAEIRDLIMQYGYLCDARNWSELLELYTDDIERTLAGTLTEHVRGKAELRAKLEAPTLERKDDSAVGAPPPDALLQLHFRHLMASEVIRLVGNVGDADQPCSEAIASVQYSLVATRDDGRQPDRGVHEGSYIFRFRRVEGRWLFSSQLIFSENARNPMFQQS